MSNRTLRIKLNSQSTLNMILVVAVVAVCIAFNSPFAHSLRADSSQGASDYSERDASFTIGVVLPLTGEFSNATGALRRGIEAGAARYGHSVVFEDDGGIVPSRAVMAVSKLVSRDRVDLVVLSSFDLVPSVAPILERAGIPGVVLWDSHVDLRERYPLIFGIGYSPEYAGTILARFAQQCLTAMRIGIISAEARWSITLAESFKRTAQAAEVVISAEELVTIEDTDFRAQMARLVARSPDVIFAPLYSRGIVSFIRQARQLGYSGRILTGEVLYDAEVKSLGRYAEGVYLTNAWIPSARLAASVAGFGTATTDASVPDSARFALAFDMMTLADRYRAARARESDPGQAMRMVDFTGVTGDISFVASKESARTQPVMVVEGGDFRIDSCQPSMADYNS